MIKKFYILFDFSVRGAFAKSINCSVDFICNVKNVYSYIQKMNIIRPQVFCLTKKHNYR